MKNSEYLNHMQERFRSYEREADNTMKELKEREQWRNFIKNLRNGKRPVQAEKIETGEKYEVWVHPETIVNTRTLRHAESIADLGYCKTTMPFSNCDESESYCDFLGEYHVETSNLETGLTRLRDGQRRGTQRNLQEDA